MSEPGGLRCPRCDAVVQPGQEYCLECGGRLGQARPGAVERASAGVAERHPWAGAWLLPALLGLVIAVLGTGAAIAISDDGDGAERGLDRDGRQPHRHRQRLDADGSGADGAATTTTAPTTTRRRRRPHRHRRANPAAVSWPRNQRGWTIVLALAPPGQRPQRRGRQGDGGPQRRPAAGRRARLVPLREPPPRLLRRLHRRLRHRGGGGERVAARPGGLPRRLPARDRAVSRGRCRDRDERAHASERRRGGGGLFTRLETYVNDFVTAPGCPYTRCRQSRRTPTFGLLTGQNRER